MISIPLFIFLFIYLAFLCVFFIFAFIHIYHIFASASFTLASFTVALFTMVVTLYTLYFTFQLLVDVNWTYDVVLFNSAWFSGGPNTNTPF